MDIKIGDSVQRKGDAVVTAKIVDIGKTYFIYQLDYTGNRFIERLDTDIWEVRNKPSLR